MFLYAAKLLPSISIPKPYIFYQPKLMMCMLCRILLDYGYRFFFNSSFLFCKFSLLGFFVYFNFNEFLLRYI